MQFKDRQSRLLHDIEKIKNGILRQISDVDAIFLCGGYGRDEGAWIYRENGDVEPYNDYDMLVITESPLPRDKLNLLRQSLAKEVGIKWVDIDQKTKQMLGELKCTIKNVDLLTGSKYIYGDPAILDRCPKLDAKKIGFYDVYLLYFTRLWTLLGSFNGDFDIDSVESSMFFCNQMAKAILAVCDVILIRRHSYVASYRERVRLAQMINKDDHSFTGLTDWAINEKLRPTIERITREKAIELYKRVYALYRENMYKSMGIKRIFFKVPQLCRSFYLLTPHHLVRTVYYGLVKRSYVYAKMIDINVAQNYVLAAYNDGALIPAYVEKAKRILLRYAPYAQINDWNDARLCAAQLRNEA